MPRLCLVVFLFALAIPARGADNPQPAASLAGAFCPAPNGGTISSKLAPTPLVQNACGQCENRCSDKTRQCASGSIKACYEAAVCLCQCNLDAGGCGSSKDALQQCVRDNQRAADDLK